jgi:hypothetical protein
LEARADFLLAQLTGDETMKTTETTTICAITASTMTLPEALAAMRTRQEWTAADWEDWARRAGLGGAS